jgi:hypothetical protein
MAWQSGLKPRKRAFYALEPQPVIQTWLGCTSKASRMSNVENFRVRDSHRKMSFQVSFLE